jgi:hypothetical protein
MRAMVFDRYGDSGMLCLRNVPVPELQDGEVLIRVGYAGVNPLRVTGTQCPLRTNKWHVFWTISTLEPVVHDTGRCLAIRIVSDGV